MSVTFSVFLTLYDGTVHPLPFVKGCLIGTKNPTLLSLIKSGDTNDTGHSLTVCTKTRMVFKFELFLPPIFGCPSCNEWQGSMLKGFEAGFMQ